MTAVLPLDKFNELGSDLQALILQDARRISDAAWDRFIEMLPRRNRIEEDITPALPGIKRDYYAHYERRYCYFVSYVIQDIQSAPKQRERAERLYESELAKELCCIEYEPDLLEVLQHMIPDPNLREFDITLKHAKRTFVSAMTEGLRTGKPPLWKISTWLQERGVRNYINHINTRYAALEPRTQLMRKRDYEEALRMAAFALGEGETDYESLPIDVRNDIAFRLHADDKAQGR